MHIHIAPCDPQSVEYVNLHTYYGEVEVISEIWADSLNDKTHDTYISLTSNLMRWVSMKWNSSSCSHSNLAIKVGFYFCYMTQLPII